MRASGAHADLQGGAHVVDVDVDVPQVGAADHEQGVAEVVQRLAQRRDAAGVAVGQQEHHLVRRTARVTGPALGGGGGGGPLRVGERAEVSAAATVRARAGDHVDEGSRTRT